MHCASTLLDLVQICVLSRHLDICPVSLLDLKARVKDGMVETISENTHILISCHAYLVLFSFLSLFPTTHCIMAADTDTATAAPTERPDIKEKGNTKDPEQRSLWARYALWLLVPIMLAVYFSQDGTVLAQTKHERQVLPSNVRPLHYDLELTPNLETFAYTGRVKIK